VREVKAAFPTATVDLWAMDEHRVGLKPILRKVWAFDGQRPIAPVQHRYEWRYASGYVHPASGRTPWHLGTTVSIDPFRVGLEAFARRAGAGPGKQIVLALDRAGWHASPKLRVPDHVHLLFLPAFSPELQPAEHLRALSDAALINRHFKAIDELEDAQAERCVALQARPDLVRSTTLFSWWPRRVKKRQGPRRS
jgi:DDE superfamily endonuclease